MNNHDLFLVKNNELPLTQIFNTKPIIKKIESKITSSLKQKVNPQLLEKIESKIHEKLCSLNERVLIKEFRQLNQKTKKYSSFIEYRNKLLSSNWQVIFDEYPVAQKLYTQQEKSVIKLVSSIIEDFYIDKNTLCDNSLCSIKDTIKDIEWGYGDTHNGMSTTLLTLKGNKKLIFKPTDGEITKAYHQFLDWMNQYSPLENYKYKSLNKKDYHWQEFVNYESCHSKEELLKYYERAGWLLCVVYLLNGRDFHYENLIAKKRNPILIDHETIIQPKLSKVFNKYSTNQKTEDSILESFLLPNNEIAKFFPRGMCGFGFHKETQISSLENKPVNSFSDDWKMAIKIVKHEFFKNNIPSHNGSKEYFNKYLEEFVSGFELCYNFLMKERNYLLSDDSPLKAFEDLQVRYVWRPTNVYVKIIEYMRLPKNLRDTKLYEDSIINYLAKAYKKFKGNKEVESLFKSEISQMFRGDVPYFEINTSSRNLVTEHGIIENFFELNCMENLERKLKKLSAIDLEFQKKLISKSVLG